MSQPWLPYTADNPSPHDLAERNPLVAGRCDETVRGYVNVMWGIQEVLREEAPLFYWLSVAGHAYVVWQNNNLREGAGLGRYYGFAIRRSF